jgi:hypothetical protein
MLMTRVAFIFITLLCSMSLIACDDGEESLSTTQSALSTSQEFDACMAGLEDCRLPDADLEECRLLEFECAPDRSAERENEWNVFCGGVDARCANEEISAELCEELQLRCELGEASQEPQEEMDPTECYASCMAGLDDAAACAERCGTEAL